MSNTILVIEDNLRHSNMFKDLLSDEGYEVGTAQDRNEVEQKMAEKEKSGNPFDLLLVDIAVPDFPEIEDAVKFFIPYKKKYPILVVSAYADQEEVKKVFEEKWRIKKPFDVNVLIERVKERLGTPLHEAKK